MFIAIRRAGLLLTLLEGVIEKRPQELGLGPIKTPPQSWKDVFFPLVHDRAGN